MTNNVGNNDATNTAAISSSKQTSAVASGEPEVSSIIRSSTSTTVKFDDTIEIHMIPRIKDEELEDLYYLQDDIETFQYELYQHAIEIQTALQYGIPINGDDDELAGITGQFQSLLMR